MNAESCAKIAERSGEIRESFAQTVASDAPTGVITGPTCAITVETGETENHGQSCAPTGVRFVPIGANCVAIRMSCAPTGVTVVLMYAIIVETVTTRVEAESAAVEPGTYKPKVDE